MTALAKLYWSTVTAWHARREARLPAWPRERLQALQDRRVRAIVRHAYRTVPFYGDTMSRLRLHPQDIRRAADLALLPIVGSEDLAAAPERYTSSSTRGETLELTTTGTTGHPKRILHDTNAVCAALAAGLRLRAAMAPAVGRQLGYREIVIATPGGTNAQVRRYHRDWLLPAVTGRLAPELISPELPIADIIAAINARKPHVVASFGRLLGHLFRYAHERALPIHRPRLVAYGGDLMPDADRLLIEHEYGIPVHSAYQSCEFLRIAYQCAHRAGFHVCTDQVAVRVVDASGRDVAPGGTGDILVSGLVNRATVLLNYRLGDRVTLASEPCACGSELPLLASIDGRSEDLLVRADGECVHEAVVLPRVYGTPGLRMAQVIQHAIDRVEVKAVIAADADGRRTEAALRECIRALLDAGNELQVEVTLTDAIAHEPSGKFKAVISACRPGLQRSREPIP